MSPDKQEAEIAFLLEQIMNTLGLNLEDQNYKDTPIRVARALIEDFTPIPFKWRVFEEKYDEMIILRNHTAFTRCPHHLERVKLNIHVGYIPNKLVIGLSKLGRLINASCKGANLQESLTNFIANQLWEHLIPIGVGVCIIGQHNCMQARGIRTSGEIITSAFRGAMLEKQAAREEFLRFVGGGK